VVIPQYKDFGQSNVERYAEAQRWFDGQLEGRDFIAGDFGIADICALTIVDFAAWIGLPLDPANTRLSAWHDRVAARPSASA
jgi:glutathione S-transferase